MRYGYWIPVFGGWLRNVEDENMRADWDYVQTLARRSEGRRWTGHARSGLDEIYTPMSL